MNLEPLFLPLLDVLLKGTIFLGLGAAALALARNSSAANRHAGFVAVFAALLLLPLTKIVDPHWSVKVEQVAVPTERVELSVAAFGTTSNGKESKASSTESSASLAAVSSALPWQAIFVGVWLGGSMLLLVRRIHVEFRLSALTGSSAPIQDARLAALIQKVAAVHETHVTVRESARCRVPLVTGGLRPVVLLPESARQWSETEVTTALCHEFGHIRRRDCLARLIADVAQAVHWLNPLVWVMARHMRVAQEQACDDLVLNFGAVPDAYAAQLVNVVRSLQQDELTSQHALAMAQPSTLEVRVLAIMDPTRKRAGRSGRGTLAGVVCVLGMLGACAAAQLDGARKQASDPRGFTEANAARGGGEQVMIEARFIEIPDNPERLPEFLRGPGQLTMLAEGADASVKGLIETDRIKLVAAPKVITSSGQLAKIELTRPFKYITDWEKDPVTEAWKSKAVATANLGITFEITPTVQADGAIELDLAPKVTELTDIQDFDAPDDGAEPDPGRIIPEGHRSQPVFATRKVQTKITIMPGGTIALGELEISKHPMVVLVTARVVPQAAPSTVKPKSSGAPEEAIAPKGERQTAKPKVSRKKPRVEPGREPLDITADELNGTGVGAAATGNVRVVHLNATMNAEHMTYDRNTRTVTLTGNVKFEDDAKEITAEKLSYELDNGAIHTQGPSKTQLKNVAVPKR